MHTLQLLLFLVMYLVIIFMQTADNNVQQNDNICQIWLIISILPMTKMSCMLKHFRSRVSAQVEQLCLLAKLWAQPPQRGCMTLRVVDKFKVTEGHSRSFELTPLSKASVSSY